MKALHLNSILYIVIAMIAFGLLIIAFVGTINTSFCEHIQGAELFWITSFIAIANALLLFTTLWSQRDSIKNSKIERSEITFFNLLRAHLQYRDEISVVRPYFSTDSIAKLVHKEIKGKQFFSMAVDDLYQIYENLQNKYYRVYNGEDAFAREKEYEENVLKTDYLNGCPKGKEMREDEKKALINYIYGITKEEINKHPKETSLDLKIFERKMKGCYEQYERSLINILRYINDSGLDVDKYTDILYSQMSMDEYKFINNLVIFNKHLLALSLDTHLSSKNNPPNMDKFYKKLYKKRLFNN